MNEEFTGITLKKCDTIKRGIYKGEKVKDVLSVKSIPFILKYYDLDEQILEEYHFKKKDVEPVEDVEYGFNEDWEAYWESMEYDKQFDDFADDEYWYDLYQEEYLRPIEPEPESSEEQMREDMYNNGYKFWIYG